jgi:hypothetical protein
MSKHLLENLDKYSLLLLQVGSRVKRRADILIPANDGFIIMPHNRQYPALQNYIQSGERKITFEFCSLKEGTGFLYREYSG